MTSRIVCFIILLILVTGGSTTAQDRTQSQASIFVQDWPENVNQPWVGPEFWANRLQDWQVVNGRLECLEADRPMRTVHLLTRSLADEPGSFKMSVNLGSINEIAASTDSWGGFLLGAGADQLDYRAAALVHHGAGPNGGIIAAVDGEGRLVLRDMEQVGYPILKSSDQSAGTLGEIEELRLFIQAYPSQENGYVLNLQLIGAGSDEPLAQLRLDGIEADQMKGNVALVSHSGGSRVRYWFDRLEVSGNKFENHPDRNFGPFMGVQYTVSNGVMNLTAQLAPVQLKGAEPVYLEIKKPGTGSWEQVQKQSIDSLGWLADFQVDSWNYEDEVPYRLTFRMSPSSDGPESYTWEGTVKSNSGWKDSVKIAALSCQTLTGNNPRGFIKKEDRTWGGVDRETVDWSHNYFWFPHNDMMSNLENQNVDFYAFLGDQIYEGGSPTQPDRRGGIKSKLDYLYKWYLWYWAFGELLRDTPSITIPDDHDVFQGNLWGEGGDKATASSNSGGFVMSPEFVNMVQHTQTSHLPDPYDPTPIKQGISVYYTDYNLGGVSFAILEDRKFKSSPDTKIEDAKLLGTRQLNFLQDWIYDWDQSWMKATLSQTIFGAVHTRGVNQVGEPAADYDTNGWPPAKRDSVLKVLREGYAFMIGGDQHLSTVVHHGVNDWNDAGYSFSTPAVSNFFPRWWLPEEEGENREPNSPAYTGQFLDGFGNKITVHAAANPNETGREPSALHDKAPGYGIVTFYKDSREIMMESWPRYAKSIDELYPGWPMSIQQQDNYGREAAGYLPEIKINNGTDPVIEVINESTGQELYVIRIEGNRFRPKVFDTNNLYTVRITLPELDIHRTLKSVSPGSSGSMIEIEL